MRVNRRKLLYALGIGALIGLLLATVWGPDWPALLVGLGATLLAAFWPARLRPRPGGAGGDPYQALLLKARGDKALVERLLRYEQQRRPDGTRDQWAESALERWNRER